MRLLSYFHVNLNISYRMDRINIARSKVPPCGFIIYVLLSSSDTNLPPPHAMSCDDVCGVWNVGGNAAVHGAQGLYLRLFFASFFCHFFASIVMG